MSSTTTENLQDSEKSALGIIFSWNKPVTTGFITWGNNLWVPSRQWQKYDSFCAEYTQNKHEFVDMRGFPGDSAGKEFTCNVQDLGSVLGLERYPREWKGYPLQCSGLKKFMDYSHGVTKSWTWLSDFHFHFLSNIYEWISAVLAFPECLSLVTSLKTCALHGATPSGMDTEDGWVFR